MSCASVMSQFTEINTLEKAQIQMPASDGNAQTGARRRVLDVCRHIASVFGRMPNLRHIIWSLSVRNRFSVAVHSRIGILVE